MDLLEFDGDAERGKAMLRKALEADPETAIVLADDPIGVQAGFQIGAERTRSGGRSFLLAAFLANDYRHVTFLDLMYAIGDRSVGAYALQTSQAIRSLMEGKPVGDVVGVPVGFNRRPATPGTPPKSQSPPPRAASPRG
jgi:hypothetical protein